MDPIPYLLRSHLPNSAHLPSLKAARKLIAANEFDSLLLRDEQRNRWRRFVVFEDKEIGIKPKYQKELISAGPFDEDNDSSDQIIEQGKQKSLKNLQQSIQSQGNYEDETDSINEVEQMRETQNKKDVNF